MNHYRRPLHTNGERKGPAAAAGSVVRACVAPTKSLTSSKIELLWRLAVANWTLKPLSDCFGDCRNVCAVVCCRRRGCLDLAETCVVFQFSCRACLAMTEKSTHSSYETNRYSPFIQAKKRIDTVLWMPHCLPSVMSWTVKKGGVDVADNRP